MSGYTPREDEYMELISDALSALNLEEAIDKLYEIKDLVSDVNSYTHDLAEESSKVIHAELVEQTRTIHSSGRWPHTQLSVVDDAIHVEYSSGSNHIGAKLYTKDLSGSLSFFYRFELEDDVFKKKCRCFYDYLLAAYPDLRDQIKKEDLFFSLVIQGNYTYLYEEFLKTLDMIETICFMPMDAN